MDSTPTKGVSRSGGGWLPKATQGVMLLLGFAVWHALHGERTSDAPPLIESTRRVHHRDADAQATQWIDATLANMRREENAEASKNDYPTTMEEFIQETRQEFEKGWRESNEEIDQIILRAGKMRSLSNPSSALAAALRDANDYREELVIFQHWLETDPDAALADMENNWPLLEREFLPAMLIRKFGIEWVLTMIAEEEKPFRLRTALANELGQLSARGDGLAGLLQFYNQVSDPKLKIHMTRRFASEWPIDQPEAAARFIGHDAPKELRSVLMEDWARMPNGVNTWEEIWMREMHERLGMEPYEYDDSAFHGTCGMGGINITDFAKQWEARQSMTFEEVIRDCVEEGKSQTDAVEEAVRIKTHQALEDSPDLIERFGEGRLSRAELLDQIRHKIPGSEAHPDVLERDVWSKIAWAADPQEVARWATELSQRGNMDELLTRIFSPSGLHGDPRISLRLDRYRIVTHEMKEDRPRSEILYHAAWEWSRWHDVSPATAATWRDGLPQTEPLYDAIRAREALERQIKENR